MSKKAIWICTTAALKSLQLCWCGYICETTRNGIHFQHVMGDLFNTKPKQFGTAAKR